ncbi:MAG: Fic family protein [Phycisphaerae bacterium]|nr:Fic family protein [Phycisphaerae bacterium]
MRLPTRPPSWISLITSSNKPFEIINDPEGRRLIQRANAAYWHWDQLRRRPLPKGWKAEEVWVALKLARESQAREFGLRSKNGEPYRLSLPEEALHDLHEIDKGLGGNIGIDEPEGAKEDRQRYLINSLMEEAIASSQIEGAATTRKVAKDMLRGNRQPRTHGERMILNNYRTICMLRDFKDRPLSDDLVIDIQRSMTQDTLENPLDEGRIRSASDRVEVVDVRDGEVLHVPPHADELPERLKALCAFANQETDLGFLHPVIMAILVHFWLSYDHPFVDGNGRTARALFYWSMLRSGYWLFEFLPISRIINQSPVRYSRAFLYAESDQCDATYFIMFHLRAIRMALRDLHSYLTRRQRTIRETRQLLVHFPELNYRQIALLHDAVTDPRKAVTFATHRGKYRVSYGTAHADLTELVERGLLIRVRHGRQFVLYPANDLAERLHAMETKQD